MTQKPQKVVKLSFKEKIFKTLDYPLSKGILPSIVGFWLILASLTWGLTAILETEKVLNLKFNSIFIIIEIISGSVFIIEYILRLWTSDINPDYKDVKFKQLKYMISLKGIIDLACASSFLVFLIFLFEPESINIVTLFRLVAFLKMIRYLEPVEIILTVIKRKKVELLITLMLSLLLLFFGSVFIYITEHDAQPSKFTNLFSSMWFTAINLFTIGYGDMVPITPLGKIVSGIISLLGVTLFLLPATVIGSGFVDEIKERNPQYDVCPNCKTMLEKDKFLKDIYAKKEGRPSKIIKQIFEKEKSEQSQYLSSKQRVQQQCYNLIQFRHPKNIWQVIMFLFFSTIITLNVLAIMVETNPILSQNLRAALDSVYIFSGIVFILEYILRIWSCVASDQEKYQEPILGRLRYIVSPLALVDLIVIVPFIIMLIPNVPPTLELLYFKMILRLLIVFKIGHYIDVFSVIGTIFRDTTRPFLTAIFLCFTFLIFVSTIIFYVEYSAQPDKFSSILSTLWFGIITYTTVGFGDIRPITTLGRFLTICFGFVGVTLFTLPAGILGASFFSSMQEYRLHKICPKCGFVLSKPKL